MTKGLRCQLVKEIGKLETVVRDESIMVTLVFQKTGHAVFFKAMFHHFMVEFAKLKIPALLCKVFGFG